MKRTWLWILIGLVVLGAGGFLTWKMIYKPKAAVTSCDHVWFFDAADFSTTDPNVCLNVGEYATDELMGIANDTVASVKIPSGYKVTAYSAERFGGQSVVMTADLKNLGAFTSTITGGPTNTMDWDDVISSVKIEASQPCGIAMYNGANYGGNGQCLPVGEYTATMLEGNRIANDTVASIKVYSGYKATVYVNDNYTGNSLEVTADLVNLDLVSGGGESRWDDKISSVKVVSAATPVSSVDLSASNKNIASGDSVTLSWTLSNVTPSKCKAGCTGSCPSLPWFGGGLTGSAIVTPTKTSTFSLTCGANSDELTITVGAQTCEAPTSETRTQSCPTGETGIVTQTRTKGSAPTCAWGEWIQTSSTCSASTTTTTTITPTTTVATTTTTAHTGPETPLVAGGVLSLLFGAYYWLRRKV
jgi:hypothetical protein